MPNSNNKLLAALRWIAEGHKLDSAGVMSGHRGNQRVGADARTVARAALSTVTVEPTDQTRLWNCMREAQALANELKKSSLAVAALGLERVYRDVYGDSVPSHDANEAETRCTPNGIDNPKPGQCPCCGSMNTRVSKFDPAFGICLDCECGYDHHEPSTEPAKSLEEARARLEVFSKANPVLPGPPNPPENTESPFTVTTSGNPRFQEAQRISEVCVSEIDPYRGDWRDRAIESIAFAIFNGVPASEPLGELCVDCSSSGSELQSDVRHASGEVCPHAESTNEEERLEG